MKNGLLKLFVVCAALFLVFLCGAATAMKKVEIGQADSNKGIWTFKMPKGMTVKDEDEVATVVRVSDGTSSKCYIVLTDSFAPTISCIRVE